MTKKRKERIKNIALGVLGGLVIMVLGTAVISKAADLFNINVTFELSDRLFGLLSGEDGKPMGMVMGSTTADNWNVGGYLTAGSYADIASYVELDTLRYTGGVLDLQQCQNDVGNCTTTAAQVCDYSIWKVQPREKTTFGLPAATSTIADCLTLDGLQKSILVWNYSTTADANITFKAEDNYYDGGCGNNTIFLTASSSVTLSQGMAGGGVGQNLGRLIFTRLSASTSTIEFIPMYSIDN